MSSLTSLQYFHGTIDARESREALQGLGEFFVRNYDVDTDKKLKGELEKCKAVVTVAVTRDQANDSAKEIEKDCSLRNETIPRLKSFMILGDPNGGGFTFEFTTDSFATIDELCEYHIGKKTELPGGGFLVRGVPRRPWQLMIADVFYPVPEIPLGKGTYGKVVKAKLNKQGQDPVDVAIKVSTDAMTKDLYSMLYTEARAMRALIHPNIIRLEGVVVEKLPIMLAIEFMDGSCLLSALKNKKVSNVMRFPISMAILYGLLYIHTQEYIHRDIATRNVMVSPDMRTVKIIDFGLAKHGRHFKQTESSKLPTNWLAPECFKSWLFSSKSDTWALNVCIWEIYHDGAAPYSNLPPSALEQLKASTPVTTPVSGGSKNSKVKDSVSRNKRGKNRKTERPELVITENLDYLPKDFIPLLTQMHTKKYRNRIELAYIADQVEKNIYPKLPDDVKSELKIHIDKRPPFDPNFKVILDLPQSIATVPTTPKTPQLSKNKEVKNEKNSNNTKTATARRKPKGKSEGTSSVPEKKTNEKTKTTRRKNK